MNRTIAAMAVAGTLLAGCSFGAGPAKVTKTSYTLQPPTTPARAPAQGAPETHATLRIDNVDAPVWLNSQDIYYQLGYTDSARLSAYSESQWVAPPPQLLEHLLQDNIAGRRLFKAVVGPDSTVPTDYALRIDLLDFKQEFSAPHSSSGVLHAQATLTRRNPQRVVAQRSFDYRVPAATADAQGGVDALTSASRAMVDDVDKWVRSAVAGGA